MLVFIKLLLAHFIGDFLFQPKSWVVEKEKLKVRSFKFYIHLFTHGILVLLFLWNFNFWLLTLLIVFLHGIIDAIKLYFQSEKNKLSWFFIDQALHITSIFVLWVLFFEPELKIDALHADKSIWIYSAAIIFITFVSGIIMQVLMSGWAKVLNEKNDDSLIYAGKVIGLLERMFVFILVVTDNWDGIGFLLAAKSVFRFGDLKESKDRKLTEYILIGTLISFGLALASGMLVLKLLEY